MKIDLPSYISIHNFREFNEVVEWLSENIGPLTKPSGVAIRGEGWYLYRVDSPRTPFWRVEFNKHVDTEDVSWFTLKYGA